MKTKSKIVVRKSAAKTVLVYEGEEYEMKPPKGKPPMRHPITIGDAMEPDLSEVGADYLLAELIRRGYRSMQKPQPKKGK